jgi:hypothetical protein
MYIGDLGSATLDSPNHEKAWRMVTSSIEAEYILLSYPGPVDAPTLPAIAAFDKLVEKPISERQVLVGIKIDSSRLLCLVPKEKVERFRTLLNTVWSSSRKTFTPREGAKLFIVKQISSKPFFSTRVAKEMWAMKEATVVTKEIKAEIDRLRDETTKRLQGETESGQQSTPISYLVDRQFDHIAYSDASVLQIRHGRLQPRPGMLVADQLRGTPP